MRRSGESASGYGRQSGLKGGFRRFTALGSAVFVGMAGLSVLALPIQPAAAATDVVTSCSGSASVPGSFPYEADNAASGDTVTFNLPAGCTSIALAFPAEIDSNQNISIAGPGAADLTIEGMGGTTVFVTSGTIAISGLTIEDGGGSDGGGIYNNGTLSLSGDVITGNSSAPDYGGGLYNASGGVATISDTTISGNSASDYGGGIYNSSGGTVTVDNSTVSGNSAGAFGGGILNDGALTVADSTIFGNSVGSGGGGGIEMGSPGTATVTNSTVADNSASFGAGLDNDASPGALTLGASIVAGNGAGHDCFDYAPTSLGYNLDDDGTCSLSGTGDLSNTSAGLDPAGLQNNGGPTETVALQSGSAAVDHVASASLCSSTDERGFARAKPCDVGAFDTDQSGTPIVSNYTGTGIADPENVAAGPDGALWFTNNANNSIGRITTSGAVTNFTGAGIDEPTGITTGPDGAVWFTNDGNNSIGRITSGTVSIYTGVGIDTPFGITSGSDGALWFVNAGNNSIGRITTSGTVTNYTGTGIDVPFGITSGPDGALWFANEGNNSIGRITTSGTVTNYTGTGIDTPFGIASGPDGALWFANEGNNSIGRITTSGTVTNYTGTGIADPYNVTSGPDGAMWFANAGNNSIGRITPSGTVTNYTGTGMDNPFDVASGSDGALWFTNEDNNSIGRITPSGAIVTGVSAAAGPSTGGTTVTISGAGFTGATAVHFGSTPATHVTVNSDYSITVTSPAGSGTVDVTVTTPHLTSGEVPADQFTYITVPVVTGVSPATGPTTADTPVTISGSGFTGATAVDFGGVAATSVHVVNDGTITATSPTGTAGRVDVTVSAPNGTSATTTSDQFTYTNPPSSYLTTCPDVPTVGEVQYPTVTSGSIPPVVSTGTDFALSNLAYQVTVPQSLATLLDSEYGPGTAVAGSVDTTVSASGASPASQNVTLDFNSVTVPDPATPFLITGTVASAPTFTATGGDVTITPGLDVSAFNLTIDGNPTTGYACTTPTPSATIAFALSGDAPTAFVTDPGPNLITPIDTATQTSGTPFSFNTGEPSAIAITPNGQTAYVADAEGGAAITPVNTVTHAVGTPITVAGGQSSTGGLAITPDGSTLYVTDDGSNTLTPIATGTNTAGNPITVGSAPEAVAITPDGSTAYVANSGDNTVTPIDLANQTAGAPISVGSTPDAIAVSPDGSTVYVADSGDNNITPIAVASDTAGTPIAVGNDPTAVAVTPDGSTVYVANRDSNTVTPISVATETAGAPISVGSLPTALAVTPDGSTVYVTNGGDNTLTPISVATDTAGTAIAAGGDPAGIAISPDVGPQAALTATTSGAATSFDASGSVPGTSPIVSYSWNFGDGTTAMTSVPTTSHTYTSNGTFTATVTETDALGTSTSEVYTGQAASLSGGPGATASSTVVIDVDNCSYQNNCQAQVTTAATPTSPQQTVSVLAPANSQAAQVLTVTSGQGALECATKHFALVSPVTSYSTTFVPSSNVTVTDLIAGVTSTAGIKICFQGANGSPFYLHKCANHSPAAPCASLAVVTGGVQATILVAPGDPRFRINGVATPIESPASISAKGVIGKTMKIKGKAMLGANGTAVPQVGFESVNGSTINGTVVSKSSSEIVVTVPNGAATGPVDMVWQNAVADGVAQVEIMVTASSITIT